MKYSLRDVQSSQLRYHWTARGKIWELESN